LSATTALYNPYIFAGPIQNPADFYGRNAQLRDVFECIRKSACVNLVGDRRSGKTSLLFHLRHFDIQKQYLANPRDYVFVYLDGQLMPADPAGFYRELLLAIKEQCPDLALPVDETAADERLVRRFLDAMRPRRLVLLVDEFECISLNQDYPARFFVFLRGLSICYNISFIVASRQRLTECCSRDVVTSPFPNIFRPCEIGPFTLDEFDQFIVKSAAPSGAPISQVRDEILKMAGLYPYLVQAACWHFYRAWEERGRFDLDIRSLVRRRFEDEVQSHWDSLWRHFSVEERETLQQLAHGEQPTRSNVVWRMEQRGYIREGKLFSEIFAAFVQERSLEPASAPNTSDIQKNGAPPAEGLWVDVETGNAYLNAQLIDPPLTKQQFDLLNLLCEQKGNICTPYMIVKSVWSEDYLDRVDDQRIAALVSRLRKRIEPEGKPWRYIVTIHGRGLKLGDGTISQDADSD